MFLHDAGKLHRKLPAMEIHKFGSRMDVQLVQRGTLEGVHGGHPTTSLVAFGTPGCMQRGGGVMRPANAVDRRNKNCALGVRRRRVRIRGETLRPSRTGSR